MKPVLWFVVAGLCCVVLTEVLGVGILSVLPPRIDAVGNFISMVVMPSVTTVALVAGLLLTANLRRVSLAKALVFPATFAGLQFVLLGIAGNPLAFRLQILAVTLIVSVLVVVWRRGGFASSAV